MYLRSLYVYWVLVMWSYWYGCSGVKVMDLVLLKNFLKVCILVVGDVMLDRYWYGDFGWILFEVLVLVVKVSKFEDKVGGVVNVVKNIVWLDGKVGLLGLVGEDESG